MIGCIYYCWVLAGSWCGISQDSTEKRRLFIASEETSDHCFVIFSESNMVEDILFHKINMSSYNNLFSYVKV